MKSVQDEIDGDMDDAIEKWKKRYLALNVVCIKECEALEKRLTRGAERGKRNRSPGLNRLSRRTKRTEHWGKKSRISAKWAEEIWDMGYVLWSMLKCGLCKVAAKYRWRICNGGQKHLVGVLLCFFKCRENVVKVSIIAKSKSAFQS